MPPFRRLGAVLFVLCLPLAATAGEVTLSWREGGLALSGELLSHDDAHYRIATRYGPLTIAAEAVDCAGACPDLSVWVPELQFIGSPALGRVVLPALAEAFAFRSGMRFERSLSDTGASVLVLADRTSGRVAARLTLSAADGEAARAALEAGRADYVLAIGEPPDDGFTSRLIALDALVPVVSRANPLRQIGLADLRAVRAGEIVDWARLGAPPGQIRLHALGPPETAALAGRAPSVPVSWHAGPEALARAVAGDRFALGLGRLSRIGASEPLALAGPCGRRLVAGPATLKAEDWPLTLPLLVRGRPGRETAIATDFFDWTGSESASRVIARTGLVAPRYAEVPIEAQGARLANALLAAGDEVGLADLQAMLRRLEGARRLTTTFRFRPGGSGLDAQSAANVAQLARAVGEGAFAGRTMLIAGYTDGAGPPGPNRRLALERAEAVRAALVAAIPEGALGPARVEVAGFGEALPMACDDTEWGRRVNRRVEVWLR